MYFDLPEWPTNIPFFELCLWENDCDGPKLAKLTKNLDDHIFLKNDSIESWRTNTAIQWRQSVFEVTFLSLH